MKRVIQLVVVCVAVQIATAGQVQACDRTNVGSVDAIDHTFPDTGGTFTGFISSGTDESWMVFEATAGDNVVVTYTNPSYGGSKIGSVFFDIGDGNIQVGDVMNVNNWNGLNQYNGNPLRVAVGYLDQGGNAINGGSTRSHSFVATVSGQYGVFMAWCNSSAYSDNSFTVSVAGISPTCFAVDAIDDQFTLINDGATSDFSVLNNDKCRGDKPISVVRLPGDLSPDRGGVAITNGTVVHYTPADGFAGFEEFSYTAQDAGIAGGTSAPSVDQDTARVVVNVLEDLVPDAVDDDVTVLQSTYVYIDVLANDTFGNEPHTLEIVTPPANGSAFIQSDDTIRYYSYYNFFGEDSFEYRITDANGDSSTATVTVGVIFRQGVVPIDIMPKDAGNNFNLRSGPGAGFEIAILSVGEFFDAPSQINPLSLKFGPRQANIWGTPRIRDVDGDGYDDLIVKFLTQQTGIACGDTSASLYGRTFENYSISGSDSINTFNCPRVRKRH